MMDLGAFLAAASQTPWAWGQHDCCAMPARWAGVPLPSYASEQEATALLNETGGLIPLWDHHGQGYAVRTEDISIGNVGVIVAMTADQEPIEVGAIFTGKRWAFVPKAGGIAAIIADPVAVWRPLCLRH